jgi:CheY-like chemotaxis protein
MDTNRHLSSPQAPVATTSKGTYLDQQTMKKTILVMDDDKRILSALALRLEAAGYVVLTDSNGVNGLETALAEHPDLIVMPATAAQEPRGPVRPASPDRPPVVLIVEDDPRITHVLALRLRAAGHIALTAPDGVDGLRLAVAHRPDLIIMDIWTPVSTGISAAHHLKEVGLGEIPIIFITASRADALRRQAMDAGAVAFFEKPYDGEVLLETIERTLRHTRTIALAA